MVRANAAVSSSFMGDSPANNILQSSTTEDTEENTEKRRRRRRRSAGGAGRFPSELIRETTSGWARGVPLVFGASARSGRRICGGLRHFLPRDLRAFVA